MTAFAPNKFTAGVVTAAMDRSRVWPGWFAGIVLLLHCALAQAFPERALTLVVPFPATGSPDINGTPRMSKLVKLVQTLSTPSLPDALALDLVSGLSAALEQTVHFERKPGGMTVAATQFVAQAAPDGHTLLFADNPTITTYPTLVRTARHDPQLELVPLAMIAEVPLALVSDADNPARILRQVIERVRFVPGQVNFAALGDGTTSHLAIEAFRRALGLQFVRVNYNGSTSALNAVATRNVEFGFVPLTAVLPFVGGGKIKLIAVASSRRHPAASNVPTIAESAAGGFEASGWFGLFAPLRTPPAVVSLLNYDINRVLAEDGWQRMLLARGLFPVRASSEEFRALIARDGARWSGLIQAAGLR
jgi:tripartite-type tricarboxylate transporter receptor subunit TctC